MGLYDGPNTYLYAYGNPLSFTDPSGLAVPAAVAACAANPACVSIVVNACEWAILGITGIIAGVATYEVLQEGSTGECDDEGCEGFDTEHTGRNPPTGEPCTHSDCNNRSGKKKQRRYYGEDGNPIKDIDLDHPRDGMQPHVHDWKPVPGRYPERQEPRLPLPGELDGI